VELRCKAPGTARWGGPGGALTRDMLLRAHWGGATGARVTSGEVEYATYRMDSDLEVFGHNPIHGS
jgi:hypothetical protein